MTYYTFISEIIQYCKSQKLKFENNNGKIFVYKNGDWAATASMNLLNELNDLKGINPVKEFIRYIEDTK